MGFSLHIVPHNLVGVPEASLVHPGLGLEREGEREREGGREGKGGREEEREGRERRKRGGGRKGGRWGERRE